ncbi:hypothetical protein Taro_021533 [Colocasia esculenta]|uniref:Uncharacterized protein n=1 Tax=Colocasia esculenta TaxID=4460 RepID=A0A843V1H6_COLES|nr:hypothetical protein [Colocasia esculenta]
MDGTHTAGSKRFHDESGETDESSPLQPQHKRLYAADRLLLDILEDMTDSGDRGPADPAAAGDLATVMRSFEEEIAALSSSPRPQQKCLEQICDDLGQSDLGFLLEASDDDLGLPPTLPPSSDEGEVVDGDAGVGGGDRGLDAMGNLWAFDDDDRSCYEALRFGGFSEGDEVAGADDGVVVDGDLFGYSDAGPSAASEFADLSWRPESLPAV